MPPQHRKKTLRELRDIEERKNRIVEELKKASGLNEDNRKKVLSYYLPKKGNQSRNDNNGSRHTANTKMIQARNQKYQTKKQLSQLSPVYEIDDKNTRPLFSDVEEDTGINTLKTRSRVRREQANQLAKSFVKKLFANRGGKSKRATRRNKNKQ
jgi:hypothetical protein